MMLPDGDGTFTGGPLDAIVLLRDVRTGRFHACFAEEAAMPGPVGEPDALSFVRLRSRMHHTSGAETLEEGRAHVRELAAQIHILPANVSYEPEDWNGSPFTVIIANWRHGNLRKVCLGWPKFGEAANEAAQ